MKSDQTVTHTALYLLLLGIMSGCGSDKKSEEVTNTSPVPESITVMLDEDTTTTLRLTATDPQGDTLTYTIISQPQHGTLSALVDNVTTYTPDANYAGSDTFTFKASDGELDSTSGLVSLTISPQNDPPVSSAVTVSTAHDEAIDIELIATDVDGDALTLEIVQGPESGTLGIPTNGVVSYTPGTVYTSSDTFTYRANDGTVDSEIAQVTVTITPVLAAPTGKLNDTGITQCADDSTNGLSCPVADYPDQDAQYGRDFNSNDDSDGHAGFSYTKLDINGNKLLANAESWSCVKDKVTGLIWEVKQGGNGTVGDEGLHDADDTYSWYTRDRSNDGGWGGHYNSSENCYGYHSGDATSYCNTEAYVNRVNAQSLCGASDWRLPAREELRSIVSYDRVHLSIDTEYFPNTKDDFYHSSSPYYSTPWIAGQTSDYAWVVHFGNGYVYRGWKLSGPVRLVRGGQ